MNSNQLQSKFEKEYINFFVKNNIVVSTNFTTSWVPLSLFHRSLFFRIKSKIPLKCYVGISKNNKNFTSINDCKFYNIVNDNFDTINFEEININYEKILNVINIIKEENKIKDNFDINVFSEGSRGYGMGFTGTFAVSLITGILLAGGVISKDDFDDYNKFVNSEIAKYIITKAWQIELISKFNNSTGENSISCIYNTSEPLLFTSEIFDENDNIQDIIKMGRKTIILSELFGEKIINDELPFDFLQVFSGIPSHTNIIEKCKKIDCINLINYSNYGNYIKEKLQIEGNYFLNNINEKNIKNNIQCFTGLLSLKLLQCFENIYCNGYGFEHIKKFIKTINDYNNYSNIIEEHINFSDLIKYYFEKNKSNDNELIGIIPIYSGKIGGAYMIILNKNYSRNTISKTLDEVKNKYPNSKINYCSYLDGKANEGITIEQFANDNNFSKFIPKGNCQFIDNKGINIVGNQNEIISKYKDHLILDSISKKIYFNGKKLNSKEIFSQSYTTELFEILIKNINKKINNSNLPLSSYSKSKNEMISKIIIPLNNYINNNQNKKLNIICKGSINNFNITLKENIVPIGVIFNIFK